MIENTCAFILAGGSGERFWPLSRSGTPKHLLRLLDERTLLETTVERLAGALPVERIFVLTNIAQVDAARAAVPGLPPENFIAEPVKRDTAPACSLATAMASRFGSDTVCIVLPADAMIHDVGVFRDQLAVMADAAARNNAIVTFGIPPAHASTAFGYLEFGENLDGGLVAVDRFVEKPDAATAETYLASGRHAWNAGIFAWRVDWFLTEAARLAPELVDFVKGFPIEGDPTDYLAQHFEQLPKISVDYAILEKTQRVLAMRAGFDWDDVGSWTALPDHLPVDAEGNCVKGEAATVDSHGNIIVTSGPGRLVALCGVENLVIVETPDALLVCHRDAAQNIKKLQPLLPESLR
jgi:mannose-1-phosphate guanylyltransferase